MKKIYILPNLITTANLVFGFLAMVAAYQSDFTRACWYIIIAAICDSLDGRIARFAKAESSFGVQYDSLSDLTSFGIAPALILFTYSLHSFSRIGVGVSAFYVVCAALRLARFNVEAEKKNDPKQAETLRKSRKGYFQGLPSPASAGLVVTAILMQHQFYLFPEAVMGYFTLVLGALVACLMITGIPFPSFKEVNWRAKGKAWILLIPLVIILFLIQAPEATLFLIGYSYLILSMFWACYLFFFRDKKQEQGASSPAFTGGHE